MERRGFATAERDDGTSRRRWRVDVIGMTAAAVLCFADA